MPTSISSQSKLPDPTVPINESWIQKNYPDGTLGDKSVIDFPYWRTIHFTSIPPLFTIIIKPKPNDS